jgi:N-acetylmuramoyl-L-alanine amidase
VLFSRRWFPTALLALLLGGCQTPSPSNKTEPALTTVVLPDPLTVATPAPLPVPEAITNHLAPASATTPAQVWPAEWHNAWVPLESWGQFNGLGKPTQLTGGMEPLYQIQTSNGLMLVKIGSQVANIGGLQYGLGFAPRLFKGLPYVHALDARKTFQALAGVLFQLPQTNRTIVIDAGHGGRDSGALCVNHCAAEKFHTLDWARRLAPLLEARGWTVVLTRSNDIECPLAERVAVADRVRADIFLSLHFNSGGANRELAGLETYCLTPTGLPSNLVREFEDDPREAYPNNHFDDQNLLLASSLHRSVLRATGAVDRGVRRARFMAVLQGQNRPAVLIEGGYLSNPDEARRIATPEYRQALAEGVARALE